MTTFNAAKGVWRSDTPIAWPGGRLDAPAAVAGPHEGGYYIVQTGTDPDIVDPDTDADHFVMFEIFTGQYDDTDSVTSEPYVYTYVEWRNRAYNLEFDQSYNVGSDHDGELYAPDTPAGDLYTYAYPLTPSDPDPGQPPTPTALPAETPDPIGAAPDNDPLAGALEVGADGAGSVTVPDIRAAGVDGGLSYSNVQQTVWFRWTPPVDATTATFSTAGSNVTAFINVWSSALAAPELGDLTFVTDSVDGGDAYHALNDQRIVQDAEATVAAVDPGLFYFVQAGSFWGKDDASFEVSLVLGYPAGLAPSEPPAVPTIVSMRDRTASAHFTVYMAPAAPAADDVAFLTTNIVMPTPTLIGDTGRVDPATFVPISADQSVWGRHQVIIGGKDVTYLRGVRTIVENWSHAQPFGPLTCTLRFPGISSFEAVGDANPALKVLGANYNVEIRRIRNDGTVNPDEEPLWQGLYGSDSDSLTATENGMTAQCLGALFQADLQQHQPSFALDARDIGHVIADELNATVGRRFAACARVTTGIMTRKRGSWGPRLTGYVQELLGQAVGDDGEQWTVQLGKGRKPRIVLKDTETLHWQITTGTRGVSLDLQRDRTQATNVIFGEGVSPDQCTWRNTRYPRLRVEDPVDYPFFDADDTISTGGNNTDAETDSGTGVSDWQREMADQGYDVEVTGVYTAADAAQAREMQRRAGLTVDGIVGPQTWTDTFAVGSNAGDLNGAYFAPLWENAATQPWLFTASGARLGPNPLFDPRVIRVERWEQMGEGITRAQGAASAHAEILRANGVDFNGTITLEVDPEEGSKWSIRAGHNIVLKHYRGANRLLHIAKVDCNPQANPPNVVLTVDSQYRDLATLAAVRARKREATDPAKALRGRQTSSRTQQDEKPVWDCENGAGRIPRHAQAAGLWSVLQIPAGQAGTISRAYFISYSSASRFSVAIFGRPVTPGDMVRLVGNPLAPDGDGGSKWDSNDEALQAAGLMIPFGGPNHACGYSPGTDPDSGATGAHTLTGKLNETGGFEYNSAHPPWLWVAIYTQSSCFVEGRLYQGVHGG